MNIEIDRGMRRNFHLEIGIGIWNFDGLTFWINFLLWYWQITFYPEKLK
jgi:hypothetical protein